MHDFDPPVFCFWASVTGFVLSYLFAFLFFDMTKEKLSVRFTGKNYSAWEFQFRFFVQGKELWGHVDGTTVTPKDKDEKAKWDKHDAQVATWILGSIDPLMINQLRSFKTANGMWEYLKRVYNENNDARRFQLELDIAKYCQGNLSVRDYYSGFLNLWDEHSALIHADVSGDTLTAVQKIYEVGKKDQLLSLKLCVLLY